MEQLSYEYSITGWVPSYNGNICAMDYRIGKTTTGSYEFAYDGLNRMTDAYSQGCYYNENATYDKHGNIETLQRKGQLVDGKTYGLLDDLTYHYSGNQLKSIKETRPNQNINGLMEFRKGTTSGYGYDKNGRLVSDLDKSITSISYNFLHLPERIQIGGNTIEYVYDASGVKQSVRHTSASGDPVSRSYSGNKVYENGNLKMILTEEGYVEKEGSSFNHYYYLKDHLGSNRVVLDASGNIVQSTEYYPFGAHYIKSTNQEKQPYKFGGKELDHLFDLDCYDFEARMYDPVLGRFMTMDPLNEKYYSISPYAYCLNNPMKYVDPDGKDIVLVNVYKTNDVSGGYKARYGISSTTQSAIKDLMKTTEGRNFFGQFAKAGDVLGGHKFEKDGTLSDKTLTLQDYSFEEGYNSNLPIGIEGSINIQDSEVTVKVVSYGENKADVGETLSHETLLHGYKTEERMAGKSTTTAAQDHEALKSQDKSHKGYQKYDSTRKQLEVIDPAYKNSFKEAEGKAKRIY
jgi:RHS repeat-associated protein